MFDILLFFITFTLSYVIVKSWDWIKILDIDLVDSDTNTFSKVVLEKSMIQTMAKKKNSNIISFPDCLRYVNTTPIRIENKSTTCIVLKDWSHLWIHWL